MWPGTWGTHWQTSCSSPGEREFCLNSGSGSRWRCTSQNLALSWVHGMDHAHLPCLARGFVACSTFWAWKLRAESLQQLRSSEDSPFWIVHMCPLLEVPSAVPRSSALQREAWLCERPQADLRKLTQLNCVSAAAIRLSSAFLSSAFLGLLEHDCTTQGNACRKCLFSHLLQS